MNIVHLLETGLHFVFNPDHYHSARAIVNAAGEEVGTILHGPVGEVAVKETIHEIFDEEPEMPFIDRVEIVAKKILEAMQAAGALPPSVASGINLAEEMFSKPILCQHCGEDLSLLKAVTDPPAPAAAPQPAPAPVDAPAAAPQPIPAAPAAQDAAPAAPAA